MAGDPAATSPQSESLQDSYGFEVAARIAEALLANPRTAAEIAARVDIRHSITNPEPWPERLAAAALAVVEECLELDVGMSSPTRRAPRKGTEPTRGSPPGGAEPTRGQFGPSGGRPTETSAGRTSASKTSTSRTSASGMRPDEMREAVRRRLRACDSAEKTACALHHLAGVPLTLTAESMGTTEIRVSELGAPLSLGPEVSYDDLSPSPTVAPVVVRRPRRRRSTVPLAIGIAAVIVGTLIVLASTGGERPTVVGDASDSGSSGSGSSELVPAVSSEVVPVPSAGCSAVNASGLVDESAEDVEPQPLLVLLPGFSQTEQQFADTAGFGMLADEAIVVGVDPDPNDQEFNTRGMPTRRNDLATVVEATESAIAQSCVDLARVHLIGIGSGAQMAGIVACSNPSLYATVSMVSGWMMPDSCELDPAVSALFIANSGDPVVSFRGGFGESASELWANPDLERTDPEPLQAVASRWAEAIGASTLPELSFGESVQTGDPTGAGDPATEGDPSETADPTGTGESTDNGDQATEGDPATEPGSEPVAADPLVETWEAPDGAAVQAVVNAVDTHDWQATNMEFLLHFIKDHARGLA